ncbi:DUF1360 domain-containing protein [Streptomyces sp. NPDC012888]|uniref:DUF1360 domain-containing protein n=1 Tax=Streptomyces sp. NPDC012888 TaxID=3364855 RepID=UPI0036CEC9B9
MLASVATFRLSRLVSKGAVTSPLRAPFTRYEEASGPAEVTEEARGDGLRAPVGTLVTCSFCTGVWVASTLAGAYALWPRATRSVTSVFTVVAGADAAQLAYAGLTSWCERTAGH